MKSKRKAQISMSFNWIFVLIAGIVFLIFFFSIIGSNVKNSEAKVSAIVVKQFETILETTSQKTGTFKTYKTSAVDLNFVCNGEEALSYYSVGETQAGSTTHDVMFAPSHLNGNQLYTWTQEWSYPFKVMNFLYITNQYNMYIFFKPSIFLSSNINKLEKDFPKNLTIAYLNSSSKPSPLLNNDLYTYILFSHQLEEFDNNYWSEDTIIADDAKLIIIDPNITTDIFNSGKVYFLDSKDFDSYGSIKNTYTSYEHSTYYGAASLYGAIFSGEKQSYECNMQKAFNRLNLLNKLNLYRIESFLPEISTISNCHYLYNGSTIIGDGMIKLIETYENETKNGFFGANQNVVMSLVQDIENKNSRISFEARCPLLY